MRCTALLLLCAGVISAREIFIEPDEFAWFVNDFEDADAPSSGPSSEPSSGPARLVDGIDCGSHPAACRAFDQVDEAFSRAQSEIKKLAVPAPPEDVAKAIRTASRGGVQHELRGILTALNHSDHWGGEREERELWKRLKDVEKNEQDGLERAMDDQERRDKDALKEREMRADGALDELQFRIEAAEAAIEDARLDDGKKLLKSFKRKARKAKRNLQKQLDKAKKGVKKTTKKQRKAVLKQAQESLKEEYERFRAGDFELPPVQLLVEPSARARLTDPRHFVAFALLGLVSVVALHFLHRPALQPNAAAEPLLVHVA